jgi:hypothetical protein
MKLNGPLVLLSGLFAIPALTLVPNGQQEAFAQVGFAQTMESCGNAGPGYTQEFMCADGEKLRVHSSRPFLIGHSIEVVPDELVEWNPVTNRAVRRMKLKADKDAEWPDRMVRDGISTTTYALEERARGASQKSGKSAKSGKSCRGAARATQGRVIGLALTCRGPANASLYLALGRSISSGVHSPATARYFLRSIQTAR